MIKLVLRLMIAFVPASLIILLSPIIKFKFGYLNKSRIGHLALDIELSRLHKNEQERGKFALKSFYFFLTDRPIANEYLWYLWKKNENIYLGNLITKSINSFLNFINRNYKYDSLEIVHRHGHQDLSILDRHQPQIKIPDSDLSMGFKALKRIGISNDSKIVCLVVRDNRYLNEILPREDWEYHSIRDTNINDYREGVIALAELGYTVVRMGKIVNSTLVCDHPNVYDYANMKIRSDFLDIFLLSQCYFTISTSSGPDAVSALFRRPIALINVPHLSSISLGNILKMYHPKMYFDLQSNRYLNIEELLAQNWQDLYTSEDFYKNNIEVRDCSPKEIKKFFLEFEHYISTSLVDLGALKKEDNLKFKLSNSWVNSVSLRNTFRYE